MDITCSELRTVVTRAHRQHQEFSAPDDDMQLGGLQCAKIDPRDMERDKEDYLKFIHMKLLPGGNRILAIVKRGVSGQGPNAQCYDMLYAVAWLTMVQ